MTSRRLTGWEGLPDISRIMYKSTYFLEGETYDDWTIRVCSSYASNDSHAARLIEALKNYWWHPATPISSNAGTDRGLPISCFVREVEDSKEGIFYAYNEAFWLGSKGTGVGTSWDDVREVGAPVSTIGQSSGIIPFMGISDRSVLAISQGGLRRSSEAVYLSVSHPEILEFVEMRTPDRDENRRMPNLDHGVIITDEFMHAVESRSPWNLISRKSGKVVQTIDAFDLWVKILDIRVRLKGEPYLFFVDTANRNAPIEYQILNRKIKLSNLCTEISLNTEPDTSNICVLSSLNLAYWEEYAPQLEQLVADILDFLDNVVQSFIDKTKGLPGFERARKGAIEQRALGLGVMGFHDLLQSKLIPWESPMAKGLNLSVFKKIQETAIAHQNRVSNFKSACPMSVEAAFLDSQIPFRRNIVTLAIAPTMSISNLCNLASSGVEPNLANGYTKKLKQGSFPIRNKYLEKVLFDHSFVHTLGSDWVAQQWASIMKNEGSVQHLEWMDQNTKDVFKTSFEIDQNWIVELAADRQQYIDQAQSINLFFPAGSHVEYIYNVHMRAWKSGMKSLYYLRSSAAHRASSSMNARKSIVEPDSCLACQ